MKIVAGEGKKKSEILGSPGEGGPEGGPGQGGPGEGGPGRVGAGVWVLATFGSEPPPPRFRSFFSLVVLVDLWPRFKAVTHPKCFSGVILCEPRRLAIPLQKEASWNKPNLQVSA